MRNLPALDPRETSILTKARGGGPQVGLGGVPELLDQRMPIERLLDDAALHALAAPVDQAHLAEARFVGGGDVLIDDRLDIAWGEGVEVE